jgi:hypothetical protein
MQNIKIKILKCFICCSLVLLNHVDFMILAEVAFSLVPTCKTPQAKWHVKLPTPYKDTYTQNNKYDKSGIHRLTYMDCSLQYLGQTGRSFKTRFNKHIREIKYNKDTSTYA